MDKNIDTNAFTHQVRINERKSITITGVKKIISFDVEEFLLDSVMGNMILKGEELEIIKLDTHDGNISIKGKINELIYLDKEKNKDNSIFNKLFK